GPALANRVLRPLRLLGRFSVARELLRRAIEIDEKAYEPDHPNLAVSYSDLALVEKDLGNLAEARQLVRRALEIDVQAFGPGHPHTRQAAEWLARNGGAAEDNPGAKPRPRPWWRLW